MGGDPFSPVFPLNQHTLSVRAHLDVLGIWASLWFKICETLYRELEILLIDNKFLPCIGFVACLYCCVCVCVLQQIAIGFLHMVSTKFKVEHFDGENDFSLRQEQIYLSFFLLLENESIQNSSNPQVFSKV